MRNGNGRNGEVRGKAVRHRIITSDADIDRAIERAKKLRDEPLVAEVEYRPGAGLDLLILKLTDGRRQVIPREELQGLQSASKDQIARVHREVSAGRATSVSGYIARVLAEQERRESLRELLRDLIEQHGEPGAKDIKWAERALQPQRG